MQKVVKAQLETAALYADMLSATVKKNGHKLKKYLQTGNEKDLNGVLLPESILALGKVVEGLQKLTGQDRNVKMTKEETLNVLETIFDTAERYLDPIEKRSAIAIITYLRAKKMKG